MIHRSTIQLPPFYEGYLQKAGSDDLIEALKMSTRQFKKRLKKIPRNKASFAYAPGKWTLKQLLQHIIDTERVFVFRALWFSRSDAAPLPGFDENAWADQAPAKKRKWDELVEEFLALRHSTLQFFKTLHTEQLIRTGTANASTMSVAALGFLCAGHLMHHLDVINRLYLAPRPKKKKSSD